MENDDISSKNNLNPQDQLNYKNKAKNLEFVKNNSNIKIPYFKEITFDDFENIEETLGKFSEQIIIRSNSSNEDKDETSSAGKFLSIGPIDKNDISLIKKSWNEVLQSYEKEDNNTVIFQDYVDVAKSVSVLTSYKVGTDSPYRTFSTYYGSQTDAVTSGRYNKIKNFFKIIQIIFFYIKKIIIIVIFFYSLSYYWIIIPDLKFYFFIFKIIYYRKS